jgi:hypothetical protein
MIVFLCSVAVGLALQACSTFISDIFFRYYYIETSDDNMRGYMLDRPGLTFGNPNALGFAIAIVALSGIAMRVVSVRESILLALAAGTCILWTASRTAMFAFLVSLLWIVCVNRPRVIVYGSLLIGLCALFKFAGVNWGDELLNDMYLRFFAESSSLDERHFIWTQLLQGADFRLNWVLGVGPHTTGVYVFDSAYVLMLYRYGVVGLLTMIAWNGWLIGSSLKYFRYPALRDIAVQRISLVIALLVASYSMAPLTDPKLCTLFYLLLSATCMRPVAGAVRAIGQPTLGMKPCAC